MEKIKADVFILGAGAGGTGLAYFLASNGIKTAVCDQNPYFGGTSVYSGVNCWEPGVSFDGLHLVLKDYLLKSGGGFVCKSYPNGSFLNPELKNDWSSNDFSKYCWGYSDFDPDGRYEDTLKRCKMFFAASGVYKRRFQFDDAAMTNALRAVFAPLNNNLIPLFGRSFADVKHKDGAVRSVILSDGTEVEAKVFADCTGNIILAHNRNAVFMLAAKIPVSVHCGEHIDVHIAAGINIKARNRVFIKPYLRNIGRKRVNI